MRFFLRQRPVRGDGLEDEVSDGCTGIEGTRGLLEGKAHLAAPSSKAATLPPRSARLSRDLPADYTPAEKDARALELEIVLEDFLDAASQQPGPVAQDVPAEMIERMRSLGYLD